MLFVFFREAQIVLTLKISEAEKKLQDRLQCLQYLATHTVEAGLTRTASERSRTLPAIRSKGGIRAEARMPPPDYREITSGFVS